MSTPGKPAHFIQDIVDADTASDKWSGRVHTRFPPEPNGYLHIGHAKSIILNYALAKANGGRFNLRFDDTNPAKEEQEYVDSIVEDVKWLGGDLDDRLFFASDYFEQMYRWAEQLVTTGKAFVCDLNAEEMTRSAAPSPAGHQQPVSRPRAPGEPRAAPPHEEGRVRPRQQDAAGEDRHGVGQHEPARPGDVPHRQGQPSPHRATTWCIYPVLRLGARARGQPRAHHPLHLHARVQEPPAALRLVPRRSWASTTRSRSSSPG